MTSRSNWPGIGAYLAQLVKEGKATITTPPFFDDTEVSTMMITKRSVITGQQSTREIAITPEQHAAWKASSRPVQECFPWLSADDREFLITGITPYEWDATFPEDDDEN